MLNLDYKNRYDEVERSLLFQRAKRYGFIKSKRIKNHKVQNIVSNNRVTIKSDIPIHRIENRSQQTGLDDSRYPNFRSKEITLIEVEITNNIDDREIRTMY